MEKKIRIGILTFHSVSNYGAVLQAYALSKFIQDKGFECELIDYQNNKMKKQYKAISLSKINFKHIKLTTYNCFMIPHVISRNYKFKIFRKKYLKISEKKYNERNLPDSFIYDGIIVGSDQVWNLDCNGSDEHYFLDFIRKDICKCYSYAASISNKRQEVKQYKKLLYDYRFISVREKSSAVLLYTILNKKIQTCVDPTLLLPVIEWNKLLKKPNTKNYILVFLMTHSEELLKNAYQFAQENNKKMVYINLYMPFITSKYNSIYSASPEEWLGWVANADYVITNSFHGTVFSIIFEKKFMVHLIEDEGKNERLLDLMNITGLKERINYSLNKYNNEEINYKNVSDIIQFEINKSNDFINKLLVDISEDKLSARRN